MKKPVCPYCGREMTESRYQGYYESFDYWDCYCEELPVKEDGIYHGSFT